MFGYLKSRIDGKKEKDKSTGEHFAEIAEATTINPVAGAFVAISKAKGYASEKMLDLLKSKFGDE